MLEHANGSAADPIVSIHQKHETSHGNAYRPDLFVRALVIVQAALLHAFRKCNGLLKRETEAVARHRIHCTRRVSHQRNAPARHGWQDS